MIQLRLLSGSLSTFNSRAASITSRGYRRCVAIDIDVGKVVVSADLLNLAQRILQRVPVPQANILQGGLVVGRIGGSDGGFGGKLALGEAYRGRKLAASSRCYSQCRALAVQLVGLDQKLLTYQPTMPTRHIAERRRNDGCDQPSAARPPEGVDRSEDAPSRSAPRSPTAPVRSHARRYR